MVARSSSGTRIRDRRIELGMRQAALAQAVGISASYLNLIEHDRRRIGGKLVLELSRELGVDPSHFSETARAELVDSLRHSVAKSEAFSTLSESVEQLAGRMPEWAEYIVAQDRRLDEQQQLVSALTDRLTHDPQLAASVHEVLSVITSVRSTAGILANEEDLDRDWLGRFHRNIYEDSQRLAESAQALVAYLEEAEDDSSDGSVSLAVEQLEHWLDQRGHHVPELENPTSDVGDFVAQELQDTAIIGLPELAATYLERYRREAELLPLETLEPFLTRRPFPDPLALANHLGCGFGPLLRRIASMPEGKAPQCGLVTCDSSGTITFRRDIDGFPVPKFGAACPLWPLYQALSEPGRPIRSVVQHGNYDASRFVTFAISEPKLLPSYDGEQVYEATMLILPSRSFGAETAGEDARQVGSSCRICPRRNCAARREPPVGGFR